MGVDYEPMTETDTAAFCERLRRRSRRSANTIIVVGKSDRGVYVACVVLATRSST